MLINNKEVRLKLIPLKTISKKAKTGYRKSNLVLMPGFTEVSDPLWVEIKEKFRNISDAVKNQKIVEFKAKIKEIEVVAEDGKKKKVTESKGPKFQDLKEADAIAVINDTWKLATLKTFLKSEKRTDIRTLIEERISDLKNKKGVFETKKAADNEGTE